MSNKDVNPIISGKRKTAISKLKFKSGTGLVYYNGIIYTSLNLFHKLALSEPIRIYEQEMGEKLAYDFFISTNGGGKEAQIQASRLAIAKALVFITGSDTLKKVYVAYDRNMIVPDARRKEANKPGDSAPRSKRQKSYR